MNVSLQFPAVVVNPCLPLRRMIARLLLLALPAIGHAAANDKLKTFDLPTGAATERLLQFSEQAGVHVLFPADAVQDLHTQAVKGDLEPRVALERMFAGTELTVVSDEAAGSLRVQRVNHQAAAPIVLPPLSVTSQGVPWKYAEAPGFVFLSHCTDNVTKGYVQGLTRAIRLLELLAPSQFLLKADLPQIVILSPQGRGSSAMSQELLNTFSGPATGEPASTVPSDLMNPNALDRLNKAALALTQVRVVRDLELIDKDRSATFTSVLEATFDGNKLFVRPQHFEYLLQGRRPALPAWVVAGLIKLYSGDQGMFQSDGMQLPAFVWLTGYESRQLANDAKLRAQALMPMADFFSAPASAQRDAQAALFVRWSLDSWSSARESNYTRATRATQRGAAAQPNREAFWKFVARAALEPISETMFHECFGVGYIEMRARLADYLRDAVRNPVRLRMDPLSEPPVPVVRDAMPAEVARIKGDWERLETGFVKVQQPEYTQSYAFQARATLMKAYRDGVRDPGVMAVIGLYEVNLGNDAAALPFLEEAVARQVVRPQAYYELARIRYAAARANPAGRNRLLSAEQLAGVIAPLVAGHTQSPPLREMFDLAAVAWSNSDVALTRRELALLDTGLGFFPQDSDLFYKAALINAAQGYKTESSRLVERGLKIARDTDNKSRLLDVLTKVDAEDGMQPVEKFRFVERRTPKAAFEVVVWAATIGAEGALTAALNLAGDSRQRAETLRRELAAQQSRPEYATPEKLTVLSYRTLFDGVTGVQVLEQTKDGDGPVKLGVRLRRKNDTIDTMTFGFQAGPGGWQLLVPDDHFDDFRSRLISREIAASALGGKAAGTTSREPEVLVIADVMAPIPEQMRPQPGKPVYYYIHSKGESDIGSVVANEPRADAAAVERAVIRVLAEQGYMQAGPRGPRSSLAMIISWGSANLDVDEMTVPAIPPPDFNAPPDPARDDVTPPRETETLTFAFGRREMMMLVGADKANQNILSPSDAAEINASLSERRAYVFVGALDAAALAKKQVKLLWRTRMSIPSLRHTLPDSLSAMLASGAPLFGQNIDRPVFVREADRKAEVRVGTPFVVPEAGKAPQK